LTRERLRLLSLSTGTDARTYYSQYLATEKVRTDAQRYGQALSLMQSGAAEEAFHPAGLSKSIPTSCSIACALGGSADGNRERQESLSTFARALTLSRVTCR